MIDEAEYAGFRNPELDGGAAACGDPVGLHAVRAAGPVRHAVENRAPCLLQSFTADVTGLQTFSC